MVRSLGMDITLDDVLSILDEHYNNIKTLDDLNQELFPLQMGEKETVSAWGVHLSKHLEILVTLFLEHFLPDHITKLKYDHFYGGLPKQFKAMAAYLKASANEKMYSDYLCAVQEAEKEEAIEPSHSQTAATTSKPKAMSFFPLWKLKGSQATKTPAVWVAHLEEENADKEDCVDSEDPDGIEGITEEFIVHLAQAVKDAQQLEKHCYHCSSLGHFIHDFPLVAASRAELSLNWKEGMALKKGAQAPPGRQLCQRWPRTGCPKHTMLNTDSLLESWSL